MKANFTGDLRRSNVSVSSHLQIQSEAQSSEDALRRLEAKIDALSKENVSLRTRCERRLESPRPASASANAVERPRLRPERPCQARAREAYAANYAGQSLSRRAPGLCAIRRLVCGRQCRVGRLRHDVLRSRRIEAKPSMTACRVTSMREITVSSAAHRVVTTGKAAARCLASKRTGAGRALKTSELHLDGDQAAGVTADTLERRK